MTLKNAALAAVAALAIAATGLFWSGGGVGSGPAPAIAAEPMSDAERQAIEGVVKDYLMAHPEVIRDAITELQRREAEAEQAEQAKALSENLDLLFDSENQMVFGNPDGDVTLVEFFDYNCGYCKRAHADMKQLVADDKNLKLVMKEFPVLGDGSVEAARVSISVKIVAPDKAEAFHDALIAERGGINAAKALAVAEELGLDRAKLEETMKSEAVSDTIAEVYALAAKLNLTGTPSYATANEVIVGAVGFDALKEKVAAARAACAGSQSC